MLKRTAFALVSSLLLLQAPAQAETDFPSKPIRIVIPYTAGGGTDSLVRVLTEHMQNDLGQPVVVENKPGASTLIGTRQVAQSAPDGYTVLVTTHGSFALTPHTMESAGFDPEKEIDYVATLGETATVLFTGADSGITSFEEFAKRAQGGELSYANSGVGNVSYMAAEFLKKDLGVELLSVPYKGVEGAVAVAAGQVDVGVNGESAIASLVEGGKLRALGVMQDERSPTMPDVPTLKELGYDLPHSLLLNAAVPRGVPEEVRSKLENAFKRALEDPEVVKRLRTTRTAPRFLTGKETKVLIDRMRNDYEQVYIANNLPFYR